MYGISIPKMSRVASEPAFTESGHFEKHSRAEPQSLRAHWRASPRIGCASRGRLTQSLASSSSCQDFSRDFSGESELTKILENPCEDTCSSAYFGMSPPVRSGCGGAANPLAHDKHWMETAATASFTNLQALRELDSSGATFLAPGSSSGDAKDSDTSPESSQQSDVNDWSDCEFAAEVTSAATA